MMKMLSVFSILSILLLSFMLTGCSGDTSDQSEDQTAVSEEQAAEEDDQALARQASAKLIKSFAGELKSELMAAFSKGGAVNAIKICQKSAPAIADSQSTEFWTIRRVSDKHRNADNRPTMEEREVLAQFADTTAPEFVDMWNVTDSITTYAYYKPIHVNQLCLKCHGNMQTLAPGVLDHVKKYYPTDKATGYREGDLRGMFVVEAVWPEGKPFAEQLVSDSI